MINLTPDSFSDGGQYLKPHPDDYWDHFLSAFDVIDIGAQSTAPRSQAISSEEECSRLKKYLPLVPLQDGHSLSLDTFRPETIRNSFSKRFYIWNDVSGIIDEAVLDWLQQDLLNRYVLTFNQVPSREETPFHINYISSHSIIEQFKKFLSQAEAKLGQWRDQVIIDPGLGFAKSREQNWLLLNHLGHLIGESPFEHWLLGLSRKSFLRFPPDMNPADPSSKTQMDQLQVLILDDIFRSTPKPRHFHLRCHEPAQNYGLKAFHEMMKYAVN